VAGGENRGFRKVIELGAAILALAAKCRACHGGQGGKSWIRIGEAGEQGKRPLTWGRRGKQLH